MKQIKDSQARHYWSMLRSADRNNFEAFREFLSRVADAARSGVFEFVEPERETMENVARAIGLKDTMATALPVEGTWGIRDQDGNVMDPLRHSVDAMSLQANLLISTSIWIEHSGDGDQEILVSARRTGTWDQGGVLEAQCVALSGSQDHVEASLRWAIVHCAAEVGKQLRQYLEGMQNAA